MGVRNQTPVVEFILLGFSGIPNSHIYLFPPFLAIYLVTVLGNLMIFILIQMDSSLHTPMYYFLSHLCFLDICLSSVTVPKILVNFLRQQQTISYHECMAQLFFLISFTGVECVLLTVMAYDRYAAICKPLHYSHLMSPKVCTILAFATWVWGFLHALIHSALSSKLYFCGAANQIHHIYCDLPPLFKIACSDPHINELVIRITSFFVGGGPFFFIFLSYVFILSSILRKRSAETKRKAFSTCASHITVVIIYFGNGALNYNRPSAGYSSEIDTLVSSMICITPMVNPLIYSLRNKDVKGAFRKVLESQRKLKRHHAMN
ncbi:olfactory receptor-like protein DTMT [Heteronotia binoei]|uniref:olfactory receptor-like protein DTMT n=1 Tax=Heteronotia binoei TaxID=13085 RepID=UPI00292DA1F9|nr:olfactory receptor-like protein DTMT [Heteronotia binoei]